MLVVAPRAAARDRRRLEEEARSMAFKLCMYGGGDFFYGSDAGECGQQGVVVSTTSCCGGVGWGGNCGLSGALDTL